MGIGPVSQLSTANTLVQMMTKVNQLIIATQGQAAANTYVNTQLATRAANSIFRPAGLAFAGAVGTANAWKIIYVTSNTSTSVASTPLRPAGIALLGMTASACTVPVFSSNSAVSTLSIGTANNNLMQLDSLGYAPIIPNKPQTLTDNPTVNWNMASGLVATVTLGGNRTLAAPTNMKIGSCILHVIQDGTGSRTITWNAVFKWPAGVAPVLSTGAGKRDIISFVCDGTNLYGSYVNDVR